MKVFISSDIEGTAGVAHREEIGEGAKSSWFDYYKQRMTGEVAAACAGAQAAGASDVLVRDAHYTARNILHTGLPRGVRLARGWAEDPTCMMSGAEGFDAALLTGYHAPSNSPANPLSHTMTSALDSILINGERASEFLMAAYTAGYLGVPVVFLSGDAGICEEAKAALPGITAVATGEGRGDSMAGRHPLDVEEAIREGVKTALSGDFSGCLAELPEWFEVQVTYKDHARAYHNSFYPGARALDSRAVAFEAGDYFEVLRFFHFVL